MLYHIEQFLVEDDIRAYIDGQQYHDFIKAIRSIDNYANQFAKLLVDNPSWTKFAEETKDNNGKYHVCFLIDERPHRFPYNDPEFPFMELRVFPEHRNNLVPVIKVTVYT